MGLEAAAANAANAKSSAVPPPALARVRSSWRVRGRQKFRNQGISIVIILCRFKTNTRHALRFLWGAGMSGRGTQIMD